MNERERWEALADALALEDELTDEERRFVDELDEPLVARERALHAALARAGQPLPASAGDRQRAEATLAAFRRAQAEARGPQPGSPRSWSIGLGAAVLAIAAALLLWFSWPAPDSLGSHRAVDRGFALELSAERADTGGVAQTSSPPQSKRAPREPDAPLDPPPEAPLELETEIETEIELETTTETTTTTTTETPTPTPTAPLRRPSRAAPPTSSASELLAAARGQVAAGEVERALETYAALRRQHPSTPEAHAASVSVGELELRRGRLQAALDAFSRYLRGGGGALAEEAHWGKIRALHRLHRTAERDAAIDELRRAHPTSVYSSRASAL